MWRKIMSVWVCALMMISAFVMAVSPVIMTAKAAGGSFGGGDGTPGNPYLIEDVLDLQAMSNDLAAHYALANDIDAKPTRNWNGGAGFLPVGPGPFEEPANHFIGTLDGQNHTVTGLHINRPSAWNVGLFGCIGVGGAVKNTGMIDVAITGNRFVAGLAGISEQGVISNSYAMGSLSGDRHVSGIVGANGGTVSGCFFSGSVVGAMSVGGLVGNHYAGIITNSYSTAGVTGSDMFIGGLVGVMTGTVSHCYAMGRVIGVTSVGGLVGMNNTGAAFYSFYDSVTTGCTDTGKGIPKTTAQMKTRSTFEPPWDFIGTWHMSEGWTYPLFLWQEIAVPQPPHEPSNPNPASGSIGVSLSPPLSAFVYDPNVDLMTVRFYNAAGPTLIDTRTNVPSGSRPTITWSGLSEKTTYYWYITAQDSHGITQSLTWNFTTGDFTAPQISATTFTDGAVGVPVTAGSYDATFSESMAEAGTFTTNLPGASGTWIGSTVFRISYDSLSYSTAYSITYNADFTDGSGNALAGDRTKEFTTEAWSGATATATGPISLPPTNVSEVTITYSWTLSPAFVDLYYTANNGMTYELAGTDNTVDGSFQWTCPASGTYGWAARASVEPTHSGLPEAAPYLLDITPPEPPTDLVVNHWGPQGYHATSNVTRYMRGIVNEVNINNLVTYNLGLNQSSTAQDTGGLGNNVNLYAGIRVWKRSSGGTETEITSGTSVAIAWSSSTGIWSNTWTPPATPMDPTDSIVVRVYVNTATPPTALQATFTTEQLGATSLDANTWTLYYYMSRAGNPTGSRWHWGTDTNNSRIDGFTHSTTAPGEPTDHNTLNWTASTSSDVSHYNIYRSDSQFGEYSLINSVASDNCTYCDLDRGQADSIVWWYIVRGVDMVDNEAENINAIPEPGPKPYGINLTGKSGWVFLSFPVDANDHIETVLNDTVWGDGDTDWDVAKWYDGQTKTWKTYRKGSVVKTFSVIDNKMGVWLHLIKNEGDQLLGLGMYASAPSSTLITLYVGWNMVGYPSGTDRLASDTLPPQADIIAIWQAETPYILDRDPTVITMSHGNAYWVRVTANCEWTVEP
ncbi:MAG: Ig-like domain-containing protein [Thermoplasmata archaeon]